MWTLKDMCQENLIMHFSLLIFIYMYMNYSSDHQLKSCNVILKQLFNNILHHYYLSGFNITVCGLHINESDITVIARSLESKSYQNNSFSAAILKTSIFNIYVTSMTLSIVVYWCLVWLKGIFILMIRFSNKTFALLYFTI